MKALSRSLILAAALVPFAAAQAQSGKPPASTSDASAAHDHGTAKAGNTKDGMSDDKMWKTQEEGQVPATFVRKAALAGMTEVELANAALQKSQNPKVRAFAERMVADHGKANKELAGIAKGKNLQVPTALDAEHKAMVEKMTAKSGAAFDTAYGEHMNMDHAKALALFEGASKSSDSELAAFAKKTLPTLKQHKDMAGELPGTRTATSDAPGQR